MTQQDPKPHVSHSQMIAYSRCGEAYRRRYIEGEKIPPGMALLSGHGVHGGAKTNFSQKVETHQDLPENEIVDASVASFEDRLERDGFVLTEEEEGRGAKSVLAEAKDQTAMMAKTYAGVIAPEYQPVMVEQPVRIVVPSAERDVFGYIDLADDRDRVVDLKTAKRRRNEDDVHRDLQLTIYAAAFQTHTGRPPSELRLDVLLKQKKIGRQVISTQRSPDDFRALVARINTFLNAVNAGIFPPAAPDAWWCSQNYCGYYWTCPYVNGAR